ncbi:YcaO-like family protein [Desulfonatronum thioautotrophicum]|uniref:YcaO-like family protein n=1 Tax=Desulfonatronum thioautotrophicum TaxID=617001 RepID=UPI000AC16DAA|nr:YcaO-like family protein [Desulfonatronum thioautotrophicum]
MSIRLRPCPKGHTVELDKVCSPQETVTRVRAALAAYGEDVLAETRRIDTGRLGIPVYLSICGKTARRIMPTRKQMGKGASAIQAEASALVELVERFSYFSYWQKVLEIEPQTWSSAERAWPGRILPISEIAKSVSDPLPEDQIRTLLDLVAWRFVPATRLDTGQDVLFPLEWFRKINEFNGSSAGNTSEESLLQGVCELVERHVCAVVDRKRSETPTIDLASCSDPVLQSLLSAFEREGIIVRLKDFSLGLPVPTVAALAYDPTTFPERSEIVFTAGTASTPTKAAIRALTEVAQLAGDFETGSNYEASGLPKFTDLGQIKWLNQGPVVALSSLPDIGQADILDELNVLCRGLGHLDFRAYSVETTHPELGIPAHYSVVPGFQFRERAINPSVGLFVGRILAEEAPEDQARDGLAQLSRLYPGASFPLFFQGLLAVRQGCFSEALEAFAQSEHGLEQQDDQALAAFYQGYAMSREDRWTCSMPHLDRAIQLCSEVKEYFNLRGVAKFKLGEYAGAEQDFQRALDLDSGSAMDLANLGLCVKLQGRTDEAAALLRSALDLDPSLDFARTHLHELESLEAT